MVMFLGIIILFVCLSEFLNLFKMRLLYFLKQKNVKAMF